MPVGTVITFGDQTITLTSAVTINAATGTIPANTYTRGGTQGPISSDTVSTLIDATGSTTDGDFVINYDEGSGATTLALNSVQLIWDDRLSASWSGTLMPDQPQYGFFGLEIKDTGLGEEQQIWKPLRGLVEVRYSVNPL